MALKQERARDRTFVKVCFPIVMAVNSVENDVNLRTPKERR